MISRLVVENYRSLRSFELSFAPLTVVIGPNGAGKTSIYRALELLRAAAAGDLAQALSLEGGMRSALWSGPRRKKGPVQIRLSVELEGLDYALALGLPRPTDAALPLDPVVKEERVIARAGGRRVTMLDRKGPYLAARDAEGRMAEANRDLWLFETALAGLVDPARYPELALVRRALLDARFYDHFRADRGSPLRAPQPMISAPSVAGDGANWAAALYTRFALVDDWKDAARSPAAIAVAAAFDGARMRFFQTEDALSAGLEGDDLMRPMSARELSDGALRYLALVAALTAVRPPPFLALNEPETSLHPDLIDPLADLIAAAGVHSQILVVTHDARLAARLEVEHAALVVRLEKTDGATEIASA